MVRPGGVYAAAPGREGLLYAAQTAVPAHPCESRPRRHPLPDHSRLALASLAVLPGRHDPRPLRYARYPAAGSRSGRRAENEPLHLLHGVPVRFQEAPGHRAEGRLAGTARAGRAGELRQAAGDGRSGQPAVVRPFRGYPRASRVRRRPGDGRRPLAGQGRDVQALGRPLCGGAAATAVPLVQRLLRRDLRAGHRALEGPGREDRRRRRLRAARLPHPRPAQESTGSG